MKFFQFFLTISICSFSGCKAQSIFGENYLRLTKSISIPGIKGRIDHLDINLKKQTVYIAALGNNTLEVVDIKKGKVLHCITGLHEPQGVAYIPQNEEIFVANGSNGDCYFYNAGSFEKVAVIHLKSDADDVRYEMYNLEIPKITLEGINWWNLTNQKNIIADEAVINNGSCKIFLDRSLPFRKVKIHNFPHQILMRILCQYL